MSGSGGGGGGNWRPEPTPIPVTPKTPKGRGGGGGDGGQPDPCYIVETTNLNSVNRTALATLRVGDQLDVVLQAGPPQRLLARIGTTIVGSITSRALPQLILCITQGRSYGAEVVALQGAICQIRIQPT